jgi:hypothetical protein
MKTNEIRKLLAEAGLDPNEHLEDAKAYFNKSPRKYGLFEKVAGKWIRILPYLESSKANMVKLCQDQLLSYAMGYTTKERSLRPVD